MINIWTYLSSEPLLWLTATLAAYVIATRLYARAGESALANPVLISVVILSLLLLITGTDYATYFAGAQFVHFLLGPATVCLAVPLFRNMREVRATAIPILVALTIGSLTAILSTYALATLLDLNDELILTVLPKSATAPVAMGIAEEIGGIPTLTAVVVILTGITGAVLATPLLNLLRITDYRARGFAVGLTSHGIGTARAFQVHPTAGAFAGIGMGLNALATALVVPLVLALI